jgi:hypothetical protein
MIAKLNINQINIKHFTAIHKEILINLLYFRWTQHYIDTLQSYLPSELTNQVTLHYLSVKRY